MHIHTHLRAGCCAVALIAVASALPAATPSEGAFPGFFALYESNRQRGLPNYITEDFLVRTYAMLAQDAVTRFEEEQALPALLELAPLVRRGIGDTSEPERIAQNFLAVFEALLEGAATRRDAPDPRSVANEVAAVVAAEGIARSQLMRQRIDYSQFRVRGKYALSPELGRYFRAVRYAGTALFPLLHSRATGIGAEDADALTGAALLISRAVGEDPDAARLYARASDPLDYLFGRPDAMTIAQYGTRAPRDSSELRLGGAALPRLRLSLYAAGVRPRVLGVPLELSKLETGVKPEDALAGWQFLPARSTPDSAAFQQLVFERVGRFRGKGAPFTLGMIGGQAAKAFPSALELAALLGSEEAARRLLATGETDYEGYEAARTLAARAMELPSGVVSDHFALLRDWLGTGGHGASRPAPSRRLNTALGFWTLQRHGAILHAKQSYTPVGKGLSLRKTPDRQRAWIEPAEGLYRALAGVAREVSAHTGFEPLARYAELAESCAELSAQALAGKAFEPEQAAFLNGLDGKLKQLAARSDGPVVVDFHTDGNSGLVAQIALGWPEVTRMKMPGGSVARGALFRVHQFKQPLERRLDDEAWSRKLARGEAPPPLLSASDWEGAGAAIQAER